MNAFHMVVWIVAIVAIAGVLEKYLKNRGRSKEAVGLNEDAQQKIDALEERIRVLERIVTEKRVDLRQQIDDL